VRVRFTISHELGHVSFLDKKPIYQDERGHDYAVSQVQEREEVLCNRIAAEMLMPAAQLRRIATSLRPSTESIRKIQEMFGVSTAALIRRIRELGLWSVGFSDWTVSDGAIPQRRSRPCIGVRSGVRRQQEKDRVFRRIKIEMERAESFLAKSLSDGNDCRKELTKESDAVTVNIVPYLYANNRGVQIIALHR
jgi:Zn-dependent peptidase ImmA (M78 family)